MADVVPLVYMYCPPNYSGVIANTPSGTTYGCVPSQKISVNILDELFLLNRGFVPASPMSAGGVSLTATGTGPVVMQSGPTITDLPLPVNPGDAASKAYADSLGGGGGAGVVGPPGPPGPAGPAGSVGPAGPQGNTARLGPTVLLVPPRHISATARTTA
jgi:hypothetical protein